LGGLAIGHFLVIRNSYRNYIQAFLHSAISLPHIILCVDDHLVMGKKVILKSLMIQPSPTFISDNYSTSSLNKVIFKSLMIQPSPTLISDNYSTSSLLDRYLTKDYIGRSLVQSYCSLVGDSVPLTLQFSSRLSKCHRLGTWACLSRSKGFYFSSSERSSNSFFVTLLSLRQMATILCQYLHINITLWEMASSYHMGGWVRIFQNALIQTMYLRLWRWKVFIIYIFRFICIFYTPLEILNHIHCVESGCYN